MQSPALRIVDNTSSITDHLLPRFYIGTELYCMVTDRGIRVRSKVVTELYLNISWAHNLSVNQTPYHLDFTIQTIKQNVLQCWSHTGMHYDLHEHICMVLFCLTRATLARYFHTGHCQWIQTPGVLDQHKISTGSQVEILQYKYSIFITAALTTAESAVNHALHVIPLYEFQQQLCPEKSGKKC